MAKYTCNAGSLRLDQPEGKHPCLGQRTPNTTDITTPARTALNAGCEGVAAIKTIQSVMEINLKTP